MDSLRVRHIFRIIALSLVFLLMPFCVTASAKQFVITLDAGHGGKDYGALGVKTNEKTITLSVVKQLGKLLEKNLPDVKVVYTRDKDVFVELSERAAIANKAASHLFVSVHVNSVDKRNKNRKRITGCQVYTLGLHKTAENLAVAKRENSVMELEKDHTEKYAGFDPNSLESDIVFELFQNKRLDQSIEFADAIHAQLVDIAGREPKGVRQAGFWVLWATSMPSVLVELDFICNPQAEKFMSSESGQEEMVIALYNAICAYINTYGSQIVGHDMPVAQALKPSNSTTVKSEAAEAPRLDVPAHTAALETSPQENGGKTPGKKNGINEIGYSEDARYYVQILASSDPIKSGSSELKGFKDVEYYRDGGFYKYAVGVADTLDDAQKLLRKVRKSFPNSFIIKRINGKRVDFIKP